MSNVASFSGACCFPSPSWPGSEAATTCNTCTYCVYIDHLIIMLPHSLGCWHATTVRDGGTFVHCLMHNLFSCRFDTLTATGAMPKWRVLRLVHAHVACPHYYLCQSLFKIFGSCFLFLNPFISSYHSSLDINHFFYPLHQHSVFLSLSFSFSFLSLPLPFLPPSSFLLLLLPVFSSPSSFSLPPSKGVCCWTNGEHWPLCGEEYTQQNTRRDWKGTNVAITMMSRWCHDIIATFGRWIGKCVQLLRLCCAVV